MKLKSGILPTNCITPFDFVDSLAAGRLGIESGAIPFISDLPGASFRLDFGDVTLNGISTAEGKWIGKRSGMWDLVTEPRETS